MDTQIIKVKENNLLDRKDLTVEIQHTGEATPAKEDVKGRIAAENNIDEEEIDVKNVLTGFGQQKSKAFLQVYEDFEYDEALEEDTEEAMEDSKEEVKVSKEITELVSGTITDVKSELEDADSEELQQALEAEKQNKNRTTLTKWINNKLD